MPLLTLWKKRVKKMTPRKNNIQLITLGCAKNRVDSEHLLRQLQFGGYNILTEETSLDSGEIDVVILNTCGFIKDAKEESIEAILTAVAAKEKGYISKVLVFGCLSQRYLSDLEKEIPEVDGYFGACDIQGVLRALSMDQNSELLSQRYITTPGHYAYLKISEGCDRTCSYCSIPLIRGKHISVPEESLLEEARFLADQGVKELILVAQDTTYYGVDIYDKRRIAQLVEKLSRIDSIEWIRLLYAYPAGFPEDLIDVMGSSDKVCKYLDIPLQHCSDKVLSAMRRSIDGAGTRELIDKIRKGIPGIALRTTMIVGHPGEGEREFDELLDFVRKYEFERLGAFTYSEEEGTYGATNLRDDISQEIKEERYDRLMGVQMDVSLKYNCSRIGRVDKVIIDSFSDGYYYARSQYEAPEVDGEILIKAGEGVDPQENIGIFAQAKITEADEYDLYGEFGTDAGSPF